MLRSQESKAEPQHRIHVEELTSETPAGKKPRLAFDADAEDGAPKEEELAPGAGRSMLAQRQIRGQRIETPSYPGENTCRVAC